MGNSNSIRAKRRLRGKNRKINRDRSLVNEMIKHMLKTEEGRYALHRIIRGDYLSEDEFNIVPYDFETDPDNVVVKEVA